MTIKTKNPKRRKSTQISTLWNLNNIVFINEYQNLVNWNTLIRIRRVNLECCYDIPPMILIRVKCLLLEFQISSSCGRGFRVSIIHGFVPEPGSGQTDVSSTRIVTQNDKNEYRRDTERNDGNLWYKSLPKLHRP